MQGFTAKLTGTTAVIRLLTAMDDTLRIFISVDIIVSVAMDVAVFVTVSLDHQDVPGDHHSEPDSGVDDGEDFEQLEGQEADVGQ